MRSVAARTLRDEELIVEIERVYCDCKLGRRISGARKIWHVLNRQDIVVARSARSSG
jgi:putative transposase